MARHLFYPRPITPLMLGSLSTSANFGSENGQEAGRALFQGIRDLLRDGDGKGYNFNVALPSPRYVVSDIVEATRSSHNGYYFVVRDTLTKFEWLFIFTGTNNTNNASGWAYYFCIGGTSNGAEYTQGASVIPDNTGSPAITTSNAFHVYVNTDYTVDTWSMEFDDTTNLTYTGGDFSHIPTWLPADTVGKANNFMPSTSWPRGLQFPLTSQQPSDIMFLFDEDDPFLLIATTNGADSDFYHVGILGDLLVTPGGSGDTYTQAAVWMQLQADASQAGDPDLGEGYVDGFNAAGARVFNLNLQPGSSYTRYNYFVEVSGEKLAKWKAVPVGNGALDKGWLKTTLAREIAPFEDSAFHRELFAAPSSALPMVKMTNAIAFAYIQNVEVFPFSFPTKE